MSRIIIEPLPGYKDVKPYVYAGFFPVSNEFYQELKTTRDARVGDTVTLKKYFDKDAK